MTTASYPAGNGKVGTADERAARRAQIHRDAAAQADRYIARTGRSINCGEYDRHAPDGCRNDGSTCICECHDPQRADG